MALHEACVLIGACVALPLILLVQILQSLSLPMAAKHQQIQNAGSIFAQAMLVISTSDIGTAHFADFMHWQSAFADEPESQASAGRSRLMSLLLPSLNIMSQA